MGTIDSKMEKPKNRNNNNNNRQGTGNEHFMPLRYGEIYIATLRDTQQAIRLYETTMFLSTVHPVHSSGLCTSSVRGSQFTHEGPVLQKTVYSLYQVFVRSRAFRIQFRI